MFEGNAQQMWTSLSKLKPLPPNTKVFCAHEYTQSNAKFALSVDPDNQALQKRAALINDLRKQARLLTFCNSALLHLACHIVQLTSAAAGSLLPSCLPTACYVSPNRVHRHSKRHLQICLLTLCRASLPFPVHCKRSWIQTHSYDQTTQPFVRN